MYIKKRKEKEKSNKIWVARIRIPKLKLLNKKDIWAKSSPKIRNINNDKKILKTTFKTISIILTINKILHKQKNKNYINKKTFKILKKN